MSSKQRKNKPAPRPPAPAPIADAPAPRVTWLIVAAVVGLGFSAASAWVHYNILSNPLYESVCDFSKTFSCTEAYTSAYGSVAGVPVALIGVLYFAFVLVLIALCNQSPAARPNLSSYVFAVATLGLSGVLYLGYASLFVLGTVCVLCFGSYAAIIALFLIAGSGRSAPGSLPQRASRDIQALARTPAALVTALAFAGIAVLAIALFPRETVSAAAAAAPATPATPTTATTPPAQAASLPPPPSLSERQQLEQYLITQPRVEVPGTGGAGAAVVLVKFNDYMCPPCGQSYREHKPIIAKLQQQYPGKILFILRDFPWDPECNPMGGEHQASCEAAAAVRLAREKGRAEALEEWLYSNQSSLTPANVRQAASEIAGVTDFDAQYPKMLELVRSEIAQGRQLGVSGTPTFYMNGLKLPNLRAGMFQAALEWELQRSRP